MSPVHHTIDYIEINTSDLAGSRAFYEQAFGWAFNDYGPTYAGIRAEAAGGTITARPYEFPGGRRFEFADPSGNVLGVWATS